MRESSVSSSMLGEFGRIRCVRALACLGLVCGALLSGCGAGTASKNGQIVYRDGPVAFRLPETPATWKAIKVSHASLAFRDDVHDASILVNGRCTTLDGDTPLMALTNHLVMGTTERTVDSQQVEPFDGREAMHTRLTAKLDGVPFGFDIFVLKKDGCVYDFVYVASRDVIDGGAPVFDAFVRGFATLPGSGAKL
jgi:hypothetical protein